MQYLENLKYSNVNQFNLNQNGSYKYNSMDNNKINNLNLYASDIHNTNNLKNSPVNYGLSQFPSYDYNTSIQQPPIYINNHGQYQEWQICPENNKKYDHYVDPYHNQSNDSLRSERIQSYENTHHLIEYPKQQRIRNQNLSQHPQKQESQLIPYEKIPHFYQKGESL